MQAPKRNLNLESKMAELFLAGDCVDGHRVHIRAKKVPEKSFSYVESPTGFKGLKYRCSRDGSSVIKISLPTAMAKVAKSKYPSVHLEVGDTLKCEKFYFIAESRKNVIQKDFEVKMMSGQHECSEGSPDARVYAEIEAPFSGIAHAVDKRLQELAEQQRTLSIKEGPISGALTQ